MQIPDGIPLSEDGLGNGFGIEVIRAIADLLLQFQHAAGAVVEGDWLNRQGRCVRLGEWRHVKGLQKGYT